MKSNEIKLNTKCNNPCHSIKIRERKEKFQNSLFDLMELYLNNNQMGEGLEITLIIIQLFQVLSYAINEKFQDIWKGNILFKRIDIILLYFKLSPSVKGNYSLYYIAYYAIILFILFVFISVIIQMINISKETIDHIACYKAIGWTLKMVSSVFFIPIADLLYSITNCSNGLNLYEIQSKCFNSAYIIHCVLGSISLLYFVCQTFVVLNLIYEIRPIKNVYSSKKTVESDSTFLFAKCLLVATCPFYNYNKVTQVIIAINTMTLLYMAYIYTSTNPYYSFRIQKAYLALSYCSAWTFLILFVGTLFKENSFNGLFVVCLLGNVLIIFGLVLSTKQYNLGLLLKSSMNSGNEIIEQLAEIIDIIEQQKDHRTAQVSLQGYVQLVNEKTIDIDTPLKNYAEIEQDKTNVFYFIFHINNLFLYAITKHPANIRLRIFYSLFLFEKAFRKDQALIQLENAKRYPLALCEEFALYRLMKSIDQHSGEIINDRDILSFTDSFSNLAYKKIFAKFKELINSASNYYVEFWSLLLNPQHENQKELAQLSNLGSQIKEKVEGIHEDFNKMQNIKPYDYEMLIHYYYFTHDVLNDKDKAYILKLRLNECGKESSAIFDESNLCHLDLNSISAYDDYEFIIVSAMDDSLGTITHISVSASSLLGYLREELIGQPIESIIPETMANSYKKYLSHIVSKYKRLFFDDYSFYHNFKLTFVDLKFYAKTKSKFIIPFHCKSAFFPNDNRNQYFYIKILRDKMLSSLSQNQYLFYILTNQTFIIQNFSANAINFLGLGSNSIHSSKDMSKNIREFSEDFLQFILDDSNHNNEDKERAKSSLKSKIELKLKIIKSKYSKPIAVTWTHPSQSNFQLSKLQNAENYGSLRMAHVPGSCLSPKRLKANDKNVMLHVDEISFLKDNQGLIFILEPIWHYNLRERPGINAPLSSLKEVISPITRKSQKLQLNDLVDEPHNSVKMNVSASDFVLENKIDKMFLPEITTKFQINPLKESYFQIDKYQLNDKVENNWIKQQALLKKNKMLNKKNTMTSSLTDSSYDDDSSIESFEGSEEQDSIKSKHNNFKVIKEDEYYFVDMKNIKLLIYDFAKKAFIDQPHFMKKSEMETKMSEEINKLKQFDLSTPKQVLVDETNNASGRKAKTISAKFIKGNYDCPNLTEKSTMIQDEILKKEITTALKKNNIQSIVYFFYILSILSCVIVASRTLGYLIQCLSFIIDIDGLTFLIYSAVRLQTNIIFAAYNIRELTLLNIPSYNVLSSDKDKYASDLHSFLNYNIFMVNTEHISNITTSPYRLEDAQLNILNKEGGIYYIIDSEYNRQLNINTLTTSLELTNSALYHIINKIKDGVKATSRDFFSYSFNSYNGLFVGLDLQIELYYKSYDDLQGELFWRILITFFSIEIALIISFFIIRLGLIKISQKNDSYLSIFYTISRRVIDESLDKCETFLFRSYCEFKTDKLEEKEAHIARENKNGANNQDPKVLTPQEEVKTKKTKSSANDLEKHQFVGSFAQAHIGVLIAIAFIVGFDIFLLNKIISFENETYRAISIYKSENNIQKHIVLQFSLLRELVFDENAIFSFKPLRETIVRYFDYSLNTYQVEKRKAEDHLQYLPQFYSDLFYRIYHKSVCHYLNKNTNNDLCSYFTDRTGFQVSIHANIAIII